ncbi:Methionine aminopeptidase [hydrothermal vent metagenome]|uniref:Methionine aminopeptidase n=1 Tax=hydrothermal vent metagenome TaxID=652676 RepID=A0A3B1EA50_9ZZZZ
MAIALRKLAEIEKLRISGLAVAKTLEYLENNVKSGMTLLEVDKMGEDFLLNLGARPSFKGLYGFPNAVCTSLNDVIIHGVPNSTVLKNGDILGLDIGSEIDGWYGDAAITIPIGEISSQDKKIISCSKDTLCYAIDSIKVGMRFKELSLSIERFIMKSGFVPLINFCGHGIGREPHSDPEIPNYFDGYNSKQGPKIKNGMVFCIEPMICQKKKTPIVDKKDNWSVRSEDGLRTSHYEHQVAIVNGKAEILTIV